MLLLLHLFILWIGYVGMHMEEHVMDMEVVSQLVAISSFLLLCELKDWTRALISAQEPLLTTPSQWLLQVFRDMFFVNLLSIDLFISCQSSMTHKILHILTPAQQVNLNNFLS